MLSQVRPRRLIVPALLALTAACSPVTRSATDTGGPRQSPVLEAARPSPPTTGAYDPYLDPTVPPPGPARPEPIAIPRDSYAPEPVRQIGSMEIPAIGLVHRIFQGVTLHNIDRGPSHWTGSAMPGHLGNTVFAGHRATHSEPFRRIDALVPGDQVIFTVDGVRSTYGVTGSMVVARRDSWIADQGPGYTGTLYACHPVGSVAERYVVRMELVAR